MKEIQNSIYDSPDFNLGQAVRRIKADYGDDVSITQKAKSLVKFGKSAALQISGFDTVWTTGGNETYVDTNIIDTASSSSASDTGITVVIEGHTVSGTGSDQEFTFVTQEVEILGQTKVTLSTPLARVSRIYNSNSVELVGTVAVYEDTALSGGTPTDVTKVHAEIPEGFQQSFKCASTIANEDYFIITTSFGSVSQRKNATVDFYLEVRPAGGVFRQQGVIGSSDNWLIQNNPSSIVPKNSDFRVRADTNTNDTAAYCSIGGYLAKVIT